MGQACSCQKEDQLFFEQNQKKSIKEIRRSIKSMVPQNSMEVTQSSRTSTMTGEDSLSGLANIKSMFNGNMRKIQDVEQSLGNKRSKIVHFAN